jgi:hypothetical protein
MYVKSSLCEMHPPECVNHIPSFVDPFLCSTQALASSDGHHFYMYMKSSLHEMHPPEHVNCIPSFVDPLLPDTQALASSIECHFYAYVKSRLREMHPLNVLIATLSYPTPSSGLER